MHMIERLRQYWDRWIILFDTFQAALWLLGLLRVLLCGDSQSPMLALVWLSRGRIFFLPDDSAALLDLLKTAFIRKTVFFFVFCLRFWICPQLCIYFCYGGIVCNSILGSVLSNTTCLVYMCTHICLVYSSRCRKWGDALFFMWEFMLTT